LENIKYFTFTYFILKAEKPFLLQSSQFLIYKNKIDKMTDCEKNINILVKMVKDNPNDMELGNLVRIFINKLNLK